VADDPFDLLVEAIQTWDHLVRDQQFAGKAAHDSLQEAIDLAETRARQLAKECT